MTALPANLDISQAKLPAVYEQAKAMLAECEKIDECKDWANKAEALASYAKMADDDSLREMADRIQARAVRRMGELLKQFDSQGRRSDQQLKEGTLQKLTRAEVAEGAGISEHQRKQAVRVANIPEDKFEAEIEKPKPATVTQLAEKGKKTRAGEADPRQGECRTDGGKLQWIGIGAGDLKADGGRVISDLRCSGSTGFAARFQSKRSKNRRR